VIPLREQVKDLPAVLDRAVSQALHPEPEGRHPTARAFGLDLERAIEELGGPFSLGNSAEFAELFLPLEESRREALLRVYPEARASRSDPRRAGVEAPPGHDVAIQTLPAVSSISGEASASGTLRSVGSPASGTLRSSGPSSPPGRALNRLLLGLFVGGGVGGALLALPPGLLGRAKGERRARSRGAWGLRGKLVERGCAGGLVQRTVSGHQPAHLREMAPPKHGFRRGCARRDAREGDAPGRGSNAGGRAGPRHGEHARRRGVCVLARGDARQHTVHPAHASRESHARAGASGGPPSSGDRGGQGG
jgi:hypothetical protein